MEIHIAVDGCDGYAGSSDYPLASFIEARDRIRKIGNAGCLNENVSVMIHPGRYEVDSALALAGVDSGTEAHPIEYRALQKGTVVLSGSREIHGLAEDTGVFRAPLYSEDFYRHLPDRKVDHVFCDGSWMHKSRYPNMDVENPYYGGWLYVDGDPVNMYEAGHGTKDHFVCTDPRLKTWSNIEDAEVFIFPRYNWINSINRIKHFDSSTGEITLATPANYDIYPGDRFYIQGVREELDNPGEWSFRDGFLEYIPLGDPANAHVSVAVSESIVTLHDTEWVSFTGICFDGSRGRGIVVENASNCVFQTCTIRNTGGEGVFLVGGGNNRIDGCDVCKTGSTGIVVGGGKRFPFGGRYISCGNTVTNCYIHHVGLIKKSVPGILIGGEGKDGAVGVTVSHNLIHDGPRWGIFSRGNDNVIEYNHIRHVNVETSDTSAIDMCDRDWTMRGTKIRYNRIHDILGYHREGSEWITPAYAFGIYLDDWTSGVEVIGNLIYRVPRGGVYLNSGSENLVERNVIIDCGQELMYFHKWTDEQNEISHVGTRKLGMRHNIIRKNIMATTGKLVPPVYGFGNCTDKNGGLDIDTNEFDGNIVCLGSGDATIKTGSRDSILSWSQWRDLGYDLTTLFSEPKFRDPAIDDYAFDFGADADALDIQPLPIDEMGPYESRARATWPIIEASGIREM